MAYENHTRWRIPFIARGAYGKTGGHAKILGVEIGWLPPESWQPHGVLEISVFRLIAFKRTNRWEWAVAQLVLSSAIRPAPWRYGEREANAARRASHKRISKLISKHS